MPLRDDGHSAKSVSELGLRDATDGQIWEVAQASGAVIITKDEDFAIRAHRQPTIPGIVWIRVGNISNRALKAWFVPQVPRLITLIEGGARIVEIR